MPDPRAYLERRRTDRRQLDDPGYTGEERRTGADRRRGGSILDGWLVFESETEKRRFMPVPEDWETYPDDRLLLLLRVATPVPRSGG